MILKVGFDLHIFVSGYPIFMVDIMYGTSKTGDTIQYWKAQNRKKSDIQGRFGGRFSENGQKQGE